MMMVDVSDEIHEIRKDISLIDKNVTRLTVLVENLLDETKKQDEKISVLQRFKNKIIGAYSATNVLVLCLIIPLLIALI